MSGVLADAARSEHAAIEPVCTPQSKPGLLACFPADRLGNIKHKAVAASF